MLILILTDSKRLLARRIPRLLEFDFDQVHKADNKIQDVDALSPLKTEEADKTLLKDDIRDLFLSILQHNDLHSDKMNCI